MAYAVLFIEPETGFHFIAGFIARNDAWQFSSDCDSAGVDAGFPFEVDSLTGKPLTLSDILKIHLGV
jgi:hypothetical protein